MWCSLKTLYSCLRYIAYDEEDVWDFILCRRQFTSVHGSIRQGVTSVQDGRRTLRGLNLIFHYLPSTSCHFINSTKTRINCSFPSPPQHVWEGRGGVLREDVQVITSHPSIHEHCHLPLAHPRPRAEHHLLTSLPTDWVLVYVSGWLVSHHATFGRQKPRFFTTYSSWKQEQRIKPRPIYWRHSPYDFSELLNSAYLFFHWLFRCLSSSSYVWSGKTPSGSSQPGTQAAGVQFKG